MSLAVVSPDGPAYDISTHALADGMPGAETLLLQQELDEYVKSYFLSLRRGKLSFSNAYKSQDYIKYKLLKEPQVLTQCSVLSPKVKK